MKNKKMHYLDKKILSACASGGLKQAIREGMLSVRESAQPQEAQEILRQARQGARAARVSPQCLNPVGCLPPGVEELY